MLSDLFLVADAYASATGTSEATVSRLALGNGNRLRVLRGGASDVGVRRIETALAWFSANWPDSAVWPKGVTRPKPTPAAEPAA